MSEDGKGQRSEIGEQMSEVRGRRMEIKIIRKKIKDNEYVYSLHAENERKAKLWCQILNSE